MDYFVIRLKRNDDLKKSIQELSAENTIKSDATHDVVYNFLISNQSLKIEKKDVYDLIEKKLK